MPKYQQNNSAFFLAPEKGLSLQSTIQTIKFMLNWVFPSFFYFMEIHVQSITFCPLAVMDSDVFCRCSYVQMGRLTSAGSQNCGIIFKNIFFVCSFYEECASSSKYSSLPSGLVALSKCEQQDWFAAFCGEFQSTHRFL